MKKRKELEIRFNDTLAQHELLLRFKGDHELIITGAPKNNIFTRLTVSLTGIFLVMMCLVIGQQNGGYNTFVIGGCLLGLIMSSAPFISFYSKKYFQVSISRSIRQINIVRGIAMPEKRIDFSDIDGVFIKKTRDDDFINAEEGNLVSLQYTFGADSGLKTYELLKLDVENESLNEFSDEFASFLADFLEKKLSVR